MDTTEVKNLEKISKELSLMHWSLVAGLFLITVFLLTFTFQKYEFDFSDQDDIFLYLCPILAIGGAFLSKYLYDKRMVAARELKTLDEKLAHYRAASIMSWALIEGPAMISVLIGMTTENMVFIAITVIMLGYLILQNVTKDKVAEELGLEGSSVIRKDML